MGNTITAQEFLNKAEQVKKMSSDSIRIGLLGLVPLAGMILESANALSGIKSSLPLPIQLLGIGAEAAWLGASYFSIKDLTGKISTTKEILVDPDLSITQ